VGFGSANALQFNQVSAPSNGLYEVDLYYASSVNRSALVSVNGGAATNLTLAATGGDTNDIRAVAVYLPLAAGSNTLTLGNLTNAAPNFDKIVVSLGSPTGLQAVAGNDQVSLTWQGTASGAVGFSVYRGTMSGGESPIALASGLATPNFTDATVTNGTTYYYTVTASNPVLGGESPPSAEVAAEPRYATTSYAYALAILSNNPAAYWRFSETNGTTAADATGKHNATYGSAVTLGIAGPRPADFLGFEITNPAVALTTGVNNSWITVPALNLNTSTLTVTAWIYPLGSQAAYTGLFFCRSGSTVSGMNYDSAGVNLGYTWNNNASTWGWSSGVQPPANQWSFVALVVQPAGATVYLINTNGVQSAANAVANTSQAFPGAGTIGTDTYAATARGFNGLMDEVAIFNQALTASQLQQLFASGHQLASVRVSLQLQGGNLNLLWPQGTLLQAPALAGPWAAASAGAPPPLSIQPTNNAMFYRVVLQ